MAADKTILERLIRAVDGDIKLEKEIRDLTVEVNNVMCIHKPLAAAGENGQANLSSIERTSSLANTSSSLSITQSRFSVFKKRGSRFTSTPRFDLNSRPRGHE